MSDKLKGGTTIGGYLACHKGNFGKLDNTLESNLKVDGGSIVYVEDGDEASGYIPHPEGAFLDVNDPSSVGAIKIALPVHGPANMVSFTVDIYNYVANSIFSIQVGGYCYQTTGNNEWAGVSAVIQTPIALADLTVRFGGDGTYSCIWIGETTSSWDYALVNVRDFICGFNANVEDYRKGWVISRETSFDTVDETVTPIHPFLDNKYLSYHTTTDWNSQDQIGVVANHSSAGATNAPEATLSYGGLTLSYDSSYSVQLTGSWTGAADLYYRSQVNTVWGSWNQIALNVNKIETESATSGTITLDCQLADTHYITITAATTIAFSNFVNGRIITIIFINPSTYITWPTTVKWPGGTAPTLSTTGTDRIVIQRITSSIDHGSLAGLAYA